MLLKPRTRCAAETHEPPEPENSFRSQTRQHANAFCVGNLKIKIAQGTDHVSASSVIVNASTQIRASNGSGFEKPRSPKVNFGLRSLWIVGGA